MAGVQDVCVYMLTACLYMFVGLTHCVEVPEHEIRTQSMRLNLVYQSLLLYSVMWGEMHGCNVQCWHVYVIWLMVLS